MPRCPAQDYADRCRAVELRQQGLRQVEIAQALQRPARWVRRTFARQKRPDDLASLRDRSSCPKRSPGRTPAEIEQAICELKQTHPLWGRRQIARQLRWRWQKDAQRLAWVSESRVRRVLAHHAELQPVPPAPEAKPARQIDYLACNLIWAADIQETHLADGSTWRTLHWIDLHSRYLLGQLTVQELSEALVVESFLAVARQHGLPVILKTDHDGLWFNASTGLPSLLTRIVTALGVYHLLVGPRQPWWNGVVERFVRTCREETHLPEQGDAFPQALEATRSFYNSERCHSRCHDQPPDTIYQSSSRRLSPDFDPAQVPITAEPTVITRQVQAHGRINLCGRTYFFHRRYAGQTITVTVNGWSASAQASDGWQRTWDLRPAAEQPPAIPPPTLPPPLLTRRVNLRGNVILNSYLYYVGIAWIGQKIHIQRDGDRWQVTLPDGSTKTWPCKHLFPQPARTAAPAKPAPPQPRDLTPFQTRRVTKCGQVAFHNRLYYVGVAHKGQTVGVTPTPEGLAVYTTNAAWITTCPWKDGQQPVKPLYPT
jgi:hypothetical protein